MRLSRLLLVGLACALAACAQTCAKTQGSLTAKEDLALVPRDADVVLMANFARMRPTYVWKNLTDLRSSDPKSKKDYDDFVQRCALDPLTQVDSAFLAFPQGPQATKEFAALLRGTFNEEKLVACAKEQMKKEGNSVLTSEYGGHKLYTDSKQGNGFACFLDGHTVVIAGKAWVRRVIDLAAGNKGEGSAKQNAPLAELLKRTHTGDALWGAGLVTQSVRDGLKNDPNMAPLQTMKNLFGSIDFAKGFVADFNVDNGGDEDAKNLVAKVTAQLVEMRKNPQIMMMGLAPMLDGVKADSVGPTFHLAINLKEQQVNDLVSRVKGLLKSAGAGMLGGSAVDGPPIGTMPGGAPPASGGLPPPTSP